MSSGGFGTTHYQNIINYMKSTEDKQQTNPPLLIASVMPRIYLAILNIDSWAGLCADATHLYGNLILSEKANVTIDNIEDHNVKYLGENIELKRPLTLELAKKLDEKDGHNSNQRAFRWATDGEHTDFMKEYPDSGLTERFDTFEQIVDFAVEKWKKLNINCPFISLYKGDKYYKNKYNASETVVLQYGA